MGLSIYAILAGFVILLPVLTFLLKTLNPNKFYYTYIVLVGKNDSLFEGELNNYLSMKGMKNPKIVRREGRGAKSLLDAFHRSPTALREAKVIGNEDSLSRGESVLYIFKLYGKTKPDYLPELENKLMEHSIK